MKVSEFIKKLEEWDTEQDINFELDENDRGFTYTNLELISDAKFIATKEGLWVSFMRK